MIIFWFRRDLRLEDNAGLFHALNSGEKVLPIFIFDRTILDDLQDTQDPRVIFIHRQISSLNTELKKYKSGILVEYGDPLHIFESLLEKYPIKAVYSNEDYEPYALSRDKSVKSLMQQSAVNFIQFKDHVIFHKNEILNNSKEPFKVFSAYKKKWLSLLDPGMLAPCKSESLLHRLYSFQTNQIISLSDIGFRDNALSFPQKKFYKGIIEHYDKTRDFPYLDGTSRLGIHFRHGTISIRQAFRFGIEHNDTWVNELIWREFYSMILFHFPAVVSHSFKSRYDNIEWINSKEDFEKWCAGETGYPIVDAGMHQLNKTGYMHNRVRMIVASFLTKHLLIDWRWGEAYFAQKLLDYELASNNGGWQWAAGTGTDAQPYFRVFNPHAQMQKFDPDQLYVKRWASEYSGKKYPNPIIDHKFARTRAIETYKKALT